MNIILLIAVLLLGAGVLLLAELARRQYRHAITECRGMRCEVAQLRDEVNRLRARLQSCALQSKG